MKLKKFDSTTANGHTHKPSITFSAVGTISVNKDFISLVKLKQETKVSIIQDEDSPDDWYLLLEDKDGFLLRANKSKDRLLFNSATTVKALMTHFKFNSKSVTFHIATEPTKIEDKEYKGGGNLYGILNHTAKYIPIPSTSNGANADDQTVSGDQNNA